MASSTDAVRIAVINRKLRVLRMIERRIQPVRGAVAVLACCRKELWLRGVPRIRRVVVIGLVTSNASCRQCLIVVVHMAVDASARRYGV